jgi:hypothetical protein
MLPGIVRYAAIHVYQVITGSAYHVEAETMVAAFQFRVKDSVVSMRVDENPTGGVRGNCFGWNIMPGIIEIKPAPRIIPDMLVTRRARVSECGSRGCDEPANAEGACRHDGDQCPGCE